MDSEIFADVNIDLKRKIFSMKICRKTFGTEVARNKGGIELASRKLNHSSSAVTRKFYIVPDDLETIYEELKCKYEKFKTIKEDISWDTHYNSPIKQILTENDFPIHYG